MLYYEHITLAFTVLFITYRNVNLLKLVFTGIFVKLN